jgi:hypothetical protein
MSQICSVLINEAQAQSTSQQAPVYEFQPHEPFIHCNKAGPAKMFHLFKMWIHLPKKFFLTPQLRRTPVMALTTP